MEHLEKNRLVASEQNDFVTKKSCLTNLLETIDTLTEALNRRLTSVIIFMDFAKAFYSRGVALLLLY